MKVVLPTASFRVYRLNFSWTAGVFLVNKKSKFKCPISVAAGVQ
jgi:hypothetical protein